MKNSKKLSIAPCSIVSPAIVSQSIVIVAAARSAIGAFNGSLAHIAAHKLGAAVIKAALERANLPKESIDDVIMGQALTANCGQNPARQAAIAAGLKHETPACGVSQICGSGLRAIIMAAQNIACGDAKIVIAGGQESMSQAPHVIYMRHGMRMRNARLVHTMLHDGLTDAFYHYHMGQTAENIAKKFKIPRKEQDEFALASQEKAKYAQQNGFFTDEIVPVSLDARMGGNVMQKDEYIKPHISLEYLQRLRPAFSKDGSVTAGNSSGLNDGAAALVLMREEEAVKRGLTPMARIVSSAIAGVDPQFMGMGPVPACKKALKKAGWKVKDLDLIEANEAFAVQALAVCQKLGFEPAKVNIYGGDIALGHPLGASGPRILTTLLYALQREKAKKALATLCIGGGMGIALCIERP